MARHRYDAKFARNHRERWFQSLASQGLEPEIFEIETIEGDGCDAERHNIAYYKSLGCRLTNATSGGEGTLGRVLSPESRAKIGSASRGRAVSLETRAKLSSAHKGIPLSAAHRAKLSIAHKGNTHTAETRAKMSASRKKELANGDDEPVDPDR